MFFLFFFQINLLLVLFILIYRDLDCVQEMIHRSVENKSNMLEIIQTKAKSKQTNKQTTKNKKQKTQSTTQTQRKKQKTNKNKNKQI